MRYDDKGRPLGVAVAGWQGASLARRVEMAGRYCRLEPFLQARHGDGLREALGADEAGWAYVMLKPQGQEQWSAWFADMEASTDPLYFAICDAADGRVLGSVGYLHPDADSGVVEIGRVHFSPRLQRTPAATEAIYLMLRQAFDWGYRRCEWKCNALNAGSIRAAQRLGFSFEGVFRQARVNWGLNRDTAWFSLCDHEWPSRRAALERWLAPDNFDADGRQRLGLAQCRDAGALGDGVRLAHQGDWAELAGLFHQYRLFYREADEPERSRAFIGERLQHGDSVILVAERAGRLLGFVQLYPLFSSLATGRSYLLNDLFVTPEARGQGLGRVLMRAARQQAQALGAQELELSTARDNHRAQVLYQSEGWQRDEVFLHYSLTL